MTQTMIRSKAIQLLFLLIFFGAWLGAHYLFDKKSAEGLEIYIIIILGLLALPLDKWWMAKRSKKRGEEVDS